MIPKELEAEFKRRVCEEIELQPEGVNRARVLTPFRFDDGDHIVVVLKRENSHWVLTDEGHSLMHISYWIDEEDLHKGVRKEIIESSLSMFGVRSREGALVMSIQDKDYGGALYSFIQAVLKLGDLTFLTRERVQSSFLQDFRVYFSEQVPEERRVFEYHDSHNDPHKRYVVDCKVDSQVKPLFVFAANTDDRCNAATITCLQFERWGSAFDSLAILEDTEKLNGRVLDRLMDVCGKMFSNLPSNKDRIRELLQHRLQ